MAQRVDLEAFFLARLVDPSRDDAALAELERRSGLEISRLVSERGEQYRRAEDDDIHINLWGHAWVADQIQTALARPDGP